MSILMHKIMFSGINRSYSGDAHGQFNQTFLPVGQANLLRYCLLATGELVQTFADTMRSTSSAALRATGTTPSRSRPPREQGAGAGARCRSVDQITRATGKHATADEMGYVQFKLEGLSRTQARRTGKQIPPINLCIPKKFRTLFLQETTLYRR